MLKKFNKIIIAVVASSFLLNTALVIAEDSDEVIEIPELKISADPLNPTLLEYTEPASVITEDELFTKSQSTLGETISLEPGVRSSFFGQGASRPVIRGFASDRVKVLRNGVTTGDVSDISEDHVVVADPLQASQIEILRGPETLLYGSSAIGGAVNVTDDSIAEFGLGKPFEGQFTANLGNSADDEVSFASKIKVEAGNFNWYFSAFNRETDNYRIPGTAESSRLMELEESEGIHDHGDEEHGEEEHGDEHGEEEHHDDEHGDEEGGSGRVASSDTSTKGFTVGNSYVFERGFLGIAVSGFDSNYGVPGHAHAHEDEHGDEEHEDEEHGDEEHGEDEHSEEEEGVRIDANQLRLDLRGRLDDVGEVIDSVKLRIGYTDYRHDEIEGDAASTRYDRETFDSRVELIHSEIGDRRGTVGFQFVYDDFAAVGEESFLTPTKTFAPAVFIYEELALNDALALKFGGRVESVNYDPLGRGSKSFVPFSLSTGSTWKITDDNKYTAGISVAYTQRAPNAIELFSNGQHLARQIFEVGDSGLDKEASWGIDLTVKKNSGLVTSSFTPFFQRFTNFINLSSDGEEEEGLPIFNYNGIGAYFWGFEVENELHIDELIDDTTNKFSIEHQLDLVRARNTDDSDNIPRIPPLRNIVRAKYNYKDTVMGSVEGVFVEKQDKVAANELETDSYAILNSEINLAQNFDNVGTLNFFVRGTNLTNNEARVHSSFLKDLAPLRGRAVLFGVRGSF